MEIEIAQMEEKLFFFEAQKLQSGNINRFPLHPDYLRKWGRQGAVIWGVHLFEIIA